MSPDDLPTYLRDRIAVQPDGCWHWIGSIDARGYGRVRRAPDGMTGVYFAHRATYYLLAGPIADGLTLDHLCTVKRCVNPAHLEPVSGGENSRRAKALHLRLSIEPYGVTLN